MENANKSKSKGKIIALVGLVIILALGGFGANWYIDQRNYVSTDNAKVTGDIFNASAKIPGKVLMINATTGSQVKKGDVLFTLETEQLQDQLNQAQAALDIAKAQLDKAAGGARTQEITAAQAGLDQAQAGYNSAAASKDTLQTTLNDVEAQYNTLLSNMSFLKNASGKYDATSVIASLDKLLAAKKLTDAQYTLKVNSIQQMVSAKSQLETQLDQLRGQINAVTAQISGAKAAMDAANSKLSLTSAGASDKDLAIIQAQVRSAQAAYDLAKLNFANASIKSPADGTVVQVNIHTGDMVAAGQTALAICDFNKLQVTANVLENDLERISLKQKVTMTIDSFTGEKFEGTVEEKGLATASVFNLFNTDNASGNYTKVSQRVPVKINLNAKGKPVIPGMSVEVKIKVTD